MIKKIKLALTLTALSTIILTPSQQINAQEQTLNIYSSRHYSTDKKLYSNFTEQTGIKIKRIDGKGDALIARLIQEGKLSPADLFITVDSGRLWRAQQANLFEPVNSKVLEEKIPSNLRGPKNSWFGFSSRARILVYNTKKIKADEIQSYQDLANPKFKGRICIRSSSNIYNQSLLASMISLKGIDAAKIWAKNVLENLARKPQGGDTDQIKAVSAGICDIALANSYYYFRLLRSNDEKKQNVVKGLAITFPDQTTDGTHINISGAGVLKNAKNKEAAIQFLEYLTTDAAQTYFSNGNNEYPVVETATVNPVVEKNRNFKIQDINVNEFGKYQSQAKMIFDEIGFP